ncbi:tyrosine-type recombinase/integrase [Sphingopyxis yananensis]|uniref:tyrosine-type recombinase/integrase n=1 Tax=Sphingopyxis yananensis TaxID=2886687 RepID=UPI001D12688B|nr:hypothetical protein [Sphingopyxis yananensis]MCC2602262.1 hypothetical protein [Sphingopyxis yananensis]
MKKDASHWINRPNAGWSIVHSGDVLRSLERDVLPDLGTLPIDGIESPKILEVWDQIVSRGAIETAHRACQRINDVYVYAIPAGVATRNPAASMNKTLPKRPRVKKQPSIIDRVRDHDTQIALVRKLLADCDAERCRATTKFALRLIALTAVRPNEIHNALRMLTGNYALMFPSERNPHDLMSENTLRQLLMRAGYYKRHVLHGFRAAMSTSLIPNRHYGTAAMGVFPSADSASNSTGLSFWMRNYKPRRPVFGTVRRC